MAYDGYLTFAGTEMHYARLMDAVCAGPECSRKVYSKGLCGTHYAQNLRTGEMWVIGERGRTPGSGPCLIEGCEAKVRSKGRCNRHYQRFLKHGGDASPGLVGRQACRCKAEKCESIDARGYCDEHKFVVLGPCLFPPCEEAATSTTSAVFCRQHQHRSNRLMHDYGITLLEYIEMADRQDWKCLICLKESELHVDHCHTGGDVRGLLCGNCNRGLGLFADNPEALVRATDYLKGVI